MKKQVIIASVAIALASSLQAQTIEETVASLELRINTLESKVTRLESFHTNPREFTITQGNFTDESFTDQIVSLNITDGEWLYVKGSGDIRQDGGAYSTELCTSDSRLTSLLNEHIKPRTSMDTIWFNVRNPNNSLTYVSSNLNDASQQQPWGEATFFSGEVYAGAERLKFKARNSLSNLNIDIWPRSSNIHMFVSSPDYVVTFKAAATREEACGF